MKLNNIPNKKINSEIVDVWNKHFKNNKESLAPLFYNNFKKNSILFIGMNPSFSSSGFKTILKDTKYEKITPEKFFKWSNVSKKSKSINDCIEIEELAKEKYNKYFGKIKEISKKLDKEWEHIDLFLYRETNQKDFLKKVIEKHNKEKKEVKFTDFGLDQIKIFKKVLNKIKPRCIVVINAKSSKIMQSEFKDQIEWDKKRGFHWYNSKKKRIPIFFSSMIGGTRALDVHSRKRLFWHIKKSLTLN